MFSTNVPSLLNRIDWLWPWTLRTKVPTMSGRPPEHPTRNAATTAIATTRRGLIEIDVLPRPRPSIRVRGYAASDGSAVGKNQCPRPAAVGRSVQRVGARDGTGPRVTVTRPPLGGRGELESEDGRSGHAGRPEDRPRLSCVGRCSQPARGRPHEPRGRRHEGGLEDGRPESLIEWDGRCRRPGPAPVVGDVRVERGPAGVVRPRRQHAVTTAEEVRETEELAVRDAGVLDG